MSILAQIHDQYVVFFGVLLRNYVVVLAGLCGLGAMWSGLPARMRVIFGLMALVGYYPVVVAWMSAGR